MLNLTFLQRNSRINRLQFLIVFQLLFLFVLPLAGRVAAQEVVTNPAKRREAKVQFENKYGYKWTLRWNNLTDTPSTLINSKIEKYRGRHSEIVRSFLNEEKDMLGIQNIDDDLSLTKNNTNKFGSSKFFYAQLYKSIPVKDAGYLIAVDNQGAIYYLSGDYYPDITLDTTPALSAEEIKQILRSDFSMKMGTFKFLIEPQLLIYPQINDKTVSYILAYKTVIHSEAPLAGWEIYQSAVDGEIIEKRETIDRINGSGYVYEANPNHGSVVTRTLHRLDNLTPRKLEGDNAKVENDEDVEASSSTGNFYYSSSNTHFDEVMAYYHCDEFEAWLINLGMATNQLEEVTLHTHNSSYYAASSTTSRVIWFSDGDGYYGLRNPTRESAVLTHEYMHQVTRTFTSLSSNNEEEAMNEAFSDFFAVCYEAQFVSSSSSGYSKIGDYIDEAGGYNYTRDLNNSYTYSQINTIDLEPNNQTEEHDRCVIFGGALWDFRQDANTSSSVVEELIFDSIDNLDSYTSFLEGRDAIIASANASGYSSYIDDLVDAFDNHGISGSAPSTPTDLYVVNEEEYDEAPELSWNGSSGATSYKVYRNRIDVNNTWVHIATTTSSSYTDYDVTINEYSYPTEDISYRVTAVNYDGESSPSSSVTVEGYFYKRNAKETIESLLKPTEYGLQNYPNPFNPSTSIAYQLPEDNVVTINIYNILGELVYTLLDADQASGYYEISWDGRDFSGQKVGSGLYWCRMVAGNFRKIAKMTLLP